MTGPYPNTIALLKTAGIDGSRVSVDDFGLGGYNEFKYDKKGNRLPGPDGRPATIRREWPSAEFAAKVVSVFAAETRTLGSVTL